MKRETSYEGKITLKVIDDGKEVKPTVEIEFTDLKSDVHLLIPALYDLLKMIHQRYSWFR